MALRNPLIIKNPLPPVFQGAYPENIYKVESRNISVLADKTKVNVEIFISIYPDETMTFEFKHDPVYFQYKGSKTPIFKWYKLAPKASL